ncbi:hypothetical protein [Bacillus sp. AFS073361]|nr:hypothetical protein [Bacillus sp. AFS073361]
MQKKKFTSWGVSFASLALVAGMEPYRFLRPLIEKATPICRVALIL